MRIFALPALLLAAACTSDLMVEVAATSDLAGDLDTPADIDKARIVTMDVEEVVYISEWIVEGSFADPWGMSNDCISWGLNEYGSVHIGWISDAYDVLWPPSHHFPIPPGSQTLLACNDQTGQCKLPTWRFELDFHGGNSGCEPGSGLECYFFRINAGEGGTWWPTVEEVTFDPDPARERWYGRPIRSMIFTNSAGAIVDLMKAPPCAGHFNVFDPDMDEDLPLGDVDGSDGPGTFDDPGWGNTGTIGGNQ